VVAAAYAATVADETKATGADETNHRQDKGLDSLIPGSLIPSLISIITFDNEPCDTESEDPATGICYSQKECANMNGEADGRCAQGYGVCCVLSGDVTITESGSYFKNVGYPNAISTPGIVTATIEPPAGTTQIFLEFENLNLSGPEEGDCSNDTLVFVGANPGPEIPVICGKNDGQHMYIDIDNSDGPYKLIVTKSDAEFDRTWNIKTTFYSDSDAGKAPQRCLQYHSEKEGELMSFNFDGDDGSALNNHDYSICFGYVSGFCDIGMTFSRFDLGNINGNCGVDAVTVGCEKICGDYEDLSARANATGPIALHVMTDDLNEKVELGFSGTYMMMEC